MLAGFLDDGLRDWIAVGGIALALLQTWLAVKPIIGARSSAVVPSVRTSPAGPDLRTPHEEQRGAEDERRVRDYGYFGAFSFLGSAIGLAVGVAISYGIIGGRTALSTNTANLLLFGCMMAFVAGAICGAYGVWHWSKGRSALKHLLVVSLVRAGVIILTSTTAGALWWCLGENRDALIEEAMWNFILSAGMILLASVLAFIKGVKGAI